MARYKGLKLLRSGYGPIEPNHYWRRALRKRCSVCGRKIRTKNHNAGH